ncbi:MAG TPA: hypothetical protein VMC02_02810 [Steroidobacteraceae bacterium]|nr:hypothetical protein [Steroidobacteraceae bacterium]
MSLGFFAPEADTRPTRGFLNLLSARICLVVASLLWRVARSY